MIEIVASRLLHFSVRIALDKYGWSIFHIIATMIKPKRCGGIYKSFPAVGLCRYSLIFPTGYTKEWDWKFLHGLETRQGSM